jgi:hypothetical protein
MANLLSWFPDFLEMKIYREQLDLPLEGKKMFFFWQMFPENQSIDG